MKEIIEVAVNIPRVSGVFHYRLPKHLKLKPGNLVLVPFGHQLVQGLALRFVNQAEVSELKEVQAVLDPAIEVSSQQIQLAETLAQESLSPLAACLALMVPPGVGQRPERIYTATGIIDSAKLSPLETILLKHAQESKGIKEAWLNKELPGSRWRTPMRKLIQAGYMQREYRIAPPRVRPKHIRTAQLSVAPEMLYEQDFELGRQQQTIERRQHVLDFLAAEATPVDLSWVYAETACTYADLKYLNEKGLVLLREEPAWRDPLAGLHYNPASAPPLTDEQHAAWQVIKSSLAQTAAGKSCAPILLHGVTGAGKTELYLRAVDEVLKAGQQAIVMVPEIALTPQTIRRFMARFPGRVGVMHSRLSLGERYDTWRRAKQGLLSVMVGPRSALFTPFQQLGLLVVDESHDSSYYQTEQLPIYNARDLALRYAAQLGIVCLLGSATPDLQSYDLAQKGQWTLLQLPNRILAHQDTVLAYQKSIGHDKQYQSPGSNKASSRLLPPVNIVDMRLELQAGNRSILSLSLQKALSEVLANKQQAILYINRRGSASYVFCRDCGFVMNCPQCSLGLTAHQEEIQLLHCHHCGFQCELPAHCPNCQSTRIRQYGSGTQSVEAEIHRLFPQANVLRLDHESTRQKGAHEIILNHFSNHRADILIGTQMLAKGHDFPMVTLVGAVLADVGLHFPDYRAGERVFQLLAQVSGRAGRSPLGGRVILQSFQPDHYVLQFAAQHDYEGFAHQELKLRQALGYPPFSKMIRLLYRDKDKQKAEQVAMQLRAQLLHAQDLPGQEKLRLIGPAPAFYSQLEGWYRWQIVIYGQAPERLIKDLPLKDWRIEVNPPSLL